jgi:quercetin dioxygenase-like cupin family protein
MSTRLAVGLALVTWTMAAPSMAQAPPLAGPRLLLREVVEGLPRGERQEVRVLTATIPPGGQTPFHTHRFPVSVYVLEGAFTLEVEGRAPVTVRAGEAMVEPPNARMTGYNRSGQEPVRVVIFYVSDPETPFLDPVPR